MLLSNSQGQKCCIIYLAKHYWQWYDVFHLRKLIPVIDIEYISDWFLLDCHFSCLQPYSGVNQCVTFLFLKPKTLCLSFSGPVIQSRLSLTDPGLLHVCTRGQCLPGSDSYFYLESPESRDRGRARGSGHCGKGVSLAKPEAKPGIRQTSPLRWSNKIIELNFKCCPASVFNMQYHFIQVQYIFLNDLLIQLKESQFGVNIGNKTYNSFSYADDFSLFSVSVTGLQHLKDTCFRYSVRWRFKFNTSKTNCR